MNFTQDIIPINKLIKHDNLHLIKNKIGEILNSNKKFFSKIGFNYLIYGIIALILQIMLVNTIDILNPDLLNNFNLIFILSSVCNYILPFPLFYYLMKKLKTTRIEASKPSLKNIIHYIAITLTLLWIGNIIGMILTALIGVVMQSDVVNPVQELINSSDIWLNLILISIIGPVFEEIFFRKLLIDRSIKYGARVSIILSATLFGFFHGNISQFFYAFLIGGFFAYVYIKTGKIIYPIALHIIVNLMGSVVSLFVAESAQNILNGTITAGNLSIVIVYSVILIAAWFIGLISLLQYKKVKFNGSKTEINLKNPIKTMFLNYGMLCFIAFFTLQMILQVIR